VTSRGIVNMTAFAALEALNTKSGGA